MAILLFPIIMLITQHHVDILHDNLNRNAVNRELQGDVD